MLIAIIIQWAVFVVVLRLIERSEHGEVIWVFYILVSHVVSNSAIIKIIGFKHYTSG